MDITEYAKTHRYRTRNRHDGRSVPPCHVDTRERTQAERSSESFLTSRTCCSATASLLLLTPGTPEATGELLATVKLLERRHRKPL